LLTDHGKKVAATRSRAALSLDDGYYKLHVVLQGFRESPVISDSEITTKLMHLAPPLLLQLVMLSEI